MDKGQRRRQALELIRGGPPPITPVLPCLRQEALPCTSNVQEEVGGRERKPTSIQLLPPMNGAEQNDIQLQKHEEHSLHRVPGLRGPDSRIQYTETLVTVVPSSHT